MSEWRCANRRKRRRVPRRAMVPHLGDIIGDEPIRLRPSYSRSFDHPRWVERGSRYIYMTTGITVGAVLVIGCVLSLLFAAKTMLL